MGITEHHGKRAVAQDILQGDEVAAGLNGRTREGVAEVVDAGLNLGVPASRRKTPLEVLGRRRKQRLCLGPRQDPELKARLSGTSRP